ncbi:MAG: formylglycine-generating enzyme family protein [Planctomycetota bacterium]|jgi:formylglycine-generating enzyme required for sulfatase activity
MIRTVPLGIILLLLLLAPLVGEESALDKARAAFDKAKDARAAAETEMQATYVALEQDFDLVRSERWPELSAPLLTAVSAAIEKKEEAPAIEKAFVETGLLSRIGAGRVATSVAKRIAAAEEPPDPKALLDAALGAVFPEETFDRCWDSAFQDLPVVESWRKVNADLEQAKVIFEREKAAAEVDPSLPPGMVLVPKGKFTAGPWTGWEIDLKKNKAQSRRVDAFYIDVHEVTNGQYREYLLKLEADRVDKCIGVDMQKGKDGAIIIDDGRENHPVRGVTFEAVRAYAESIGKRLPEEMEWEKAARGTDARMYPWGDEFAADATNWHGRGLGRPTAVGASPKDRSPYRVMDMAGNVSELTFTLAGGKPARGKLKLSDAVVYRGGNYNEGRESAATTYRWTIGAVSGKSDVVGFRCAMSERDWKRK